MSYIELNSINFADEVTKETEMPVLVDFWAPWCQPCLMLSPTIEELADELDGEVKVCKLNCDEENEYAIMMGIMSIPCLVLFVGGQEKERLVGLHSKEEIIDFINKNK